MAFITHADEDHISGILEIIQAGEIRIDSVILPDTSMRDAAYGKIEQAAIDSGVKVLYISKGNQLQQGELKLCCLHPEKGYSAQNRNAYSTVLDVTYKRFKLLLTGDLEQEGEQLVTELLEGGNGGYTLLKAAHHGSDTSTGEAFLEAAMPAATIISCGEDNSYGHPHPEVLRRLEKAGSRIYRTQFCGAVMVETDGSRARIKGYKEVLNK